MQSCSSRPDNSAPLAAAGRSATPAPQAHPAAAPSNTRPASQAPRPAASHAATTHSPHTGLTKLAVVKKVPGCTPHTAPQPPGSKPRSTSRPTQCGASPQRQHAPRQTTGSDAHRTADLAQARMVAALIRVPVPEPLPHARLPAVRSNPQSQAQRILPGRSPEPGCRSRPQTASAIPRAAQPPSRTTAAAPLHPALPEAVPMLPCCTQTPDPRSAPAATTAPAYTTAARRQVATPRLALAPQVRILHAGPPQHAPPARPVAAPQTPTAT